MMGIDDGQGGLRPRSTRHAARHYWRPRQAATGRQGRPLVSARLRVALNAIVCVVHTAAVCSLLANAGCGLVVNGTHQNLRAAMRPAGTELAVYDFDGTLIASLPDAANAEVKIPRPKGGRSYLVVASKQGYCPRYWLTDTNDTPAAFVLDMLFLFPTLGLSIIVDGYTGGRFAFDPETYAGSLEPEKECANAQSD